MIHCTLDELVGSPVGAERKVISFCGAGGKTSGIHALRDYLLSQHKKVLVTTTTHMFMEYGCVSEPQEIKRRLREEGYAFAGVPDFPSGGAVSSMDKSTAVSKISSTDKNTAIRKITGLSNETRLLAEAEADVTLIEADGARRMPFKVPKAWEPVIPEETTDIVLVMGMDAVGHKISDVCYNPEGVACALDVTEDEVLTREMMLKAYERTYVKNIRGQMGDMRIFLHMNQKIPGRSIIDDDLFIL